MAMTNRQNQKNDCFILLTIDDMVPQNHLVRKLEAGIDFTFIYSKVEHLYSKAGRPSIDPVVLFKLLILNIVDGNNSMRKTCNRAQTDMAYRWFLGIDVYESVPNYSTWSQNYIRRYKDSSIFDDIFNEILSQAIRRNFVDVTTVFGDGTHQKANANKNKNHKEEVELTAKKYEKAILEEINDDRECIGLKPVESLIKKELINDEETGEVKEITETKTITVSNTDPESGLFHKGEKQKCFAYSHQTFCDKNGFVLITKAFPGNLHDSVTFFETFDELNKRFPGMIQNVSLDAGYKVPAICRELLEQGKIPLMPYTRPKTKKGYLKKNDYVYDEYYDFFICPNIKTLSYTLTNKSGYREYKCDPKDCQECPYKSQCTKSDAKTVTRHVWEEYVEQVNEIRYTQKWRDLYPRRKETIERVFADCKEKFGMRFTRLKGLKKNQHQMLMVFATHNLKKMALWSWKTPSVPLFFCLYRAIFDIFEKNNKQKTRILI